MIKSQPTNKSTSEAQSSISVGVKYVFFGTPKFAAIILEKLIDAGMPPAVLVCNPDRPAGRKQVITPPPTKELVIRHQSLDIRIFQPGDPSLLMSNVSFLMSDFFIVAAYAKILPKEILEIPKLGTIGVHPSLLPRYRGPSPVQSAILAGEKETGVSLFLMDEQLDHGPIITERKIVINDLFSNSRELESKLAQVGAELLIETLPKFITPLPHDTQQGVLRGLPQDESQATYTKKITSQDAFVSEKDLEAATSGRSPEKAALIDRKIRALNPEPGTWTIQNGKRIKLLEAGLKSGKLILKKTQQAGKRPSG